MLAPAPAPPSLGIPVLPPPPQTLAPGPSHSSQAEAPLGPNSTSSVLCLLDEELLCLGMSPGRLQGAAPGRISREEKLVESGRGLSGAPCA